MKKVLFLLIFAGIFACTEKHNLSITGTVDGLSSGTMYLQKFNNKMFELIDSAVIKDGKFSFSRNAELPEIYGLTPNVDKGSFMVFLDENPVTVTFDTSRYYRNTKIEGSALHDLYADYRKQRDVKIDEFIKQNPKSLVSAYALYRDFSYRLSADEIRSNIALLDSALWKTPYVKVLEELVVTLELVAVGKPAPDFSLNSPEGVAVKLSEKLGKGYVLLDFWASWCGPCRHENPSIVAAFNRYKDRGFDIFAVSLDRDKEAWLKAIAADSLTWTHVSDLQNWNSAPAKLYGVRAIPSNVLIDKDGVIVAKNLRGEELEKTLSELLK